MKKFLFGNNAFLWFNPTSRKAFLKKKVLSELPKIKEHPFEKQKYYRWLAEVYRTIAIVERL
jgi:hypothetical protein